jgi:hypothetical protein
MDDCHRVGTLRRLSASLPALFFIACASSPSDPSVATDAREPTDAAPIVAANDIETVDISELDTGLVCERSAPTGSRISEEQCYTKEEYAQWQAMRHETAQREVADMRDLQRNRDLAEQEARRQAMESALRGGF